MFLTEKQEIELAERYQVLGDLKALHQLVSSHMPFVINIAKKYSGYGIPIADLIQEGNIGLIKAAKRFVPKGGVRFSTFAVHWIKGDIQEYAVKNWRMVKIATTKAQRKLFFNKGRLDWDNSQEIVKLLAVSNEDVILMRDKLKGTEFSYDPVFDDVQLIEEEIGYQEDNNNLYTAIDKLDTRSRDIIEQRWLAENKVTMKALAEKYDISIERVNQIEKGALLKLRKLMEE